MFVTPYPLCLDSVATGRKGTILTSSVVENSLQKASDVKVDTKDSSECDASQVLVMKDEDTGVDILV